MVDSPAEASALADEHACEHVQILTEEPFLALDARKNFGALFLGRRTCVSYGTKCIGTNYVLPTRGAARYTGALWAGKLRKTCTYQIVKDDPASGELGLLCGRAAKAENFEGHARSGNLRAHQFLHKQCEWITSS